MNETHTPLPWTFSPWHIEEGPSAVRAPAGHIVATTASDSDAQLIVRAVNSHEALVAALVKAREYCDDGSALMDEGDLLPTIDAALTLARST